MNLLNRNKWEIIAFFIQLSEHFVNNAQRQKKKTDKKLVYLLFLGQTIYKN